MERRRRLGSVKRELINKSREAMLAAVYLFNSPLAVFRTEAFIILAVIAWTYLLHAYYKGIGVDYRNYKYKGKRKRFDRTKRGSFMYWQLERCLDDVKCPLNKATIQNLRFLIGLRHEIEHHGSGKIENYISAKVQACALNYNSYLQNFFGEQYGLNRELALAIQFSSFEPKQVELLKTNEHIDSKIKNYIVKFESNLPDEILSSPNYAYRILFVPVDAKRQGKEDKVIEFIKSDSPLAKELDKTYAVVKEIEKKKFLPGEIVKTMQNKGYIKFNMRTHTLLWKERNAKNPKFNYGTLVSGHWYWYENWFNEVEKYCKDNAEKFIHCG